MVPLKLQIKNFLSYGPTQIVDFAPYHLICLSGRNGHGKSAMLDAITWALWGVARKNSGSPKPDEGLVKLGQSQMSVALDFEFNHELYRVKREFTNFTGKSTAVLDFAIFDKTKNIFKPLTDKTIKTTQQKIEETIHLNYDEFINSAFLKQGQSNEFSKKSPKERKDILAGILGLDKFEKMRKTISEKTKTINLNKASIAKNLEYLDKQLQESENVNLRLDEANNELNNFNEKISSITKTIEIFELERSSLQNKINNFNFQKIKLQSLEDQKQDLSINLEKIINSFRQNHNLILNSVNASNLLNQEPEIFSRLTEIEDKLNKRSELKAILIQKKADLQILVNDLALNFHKNSESKKNELNRYEFELEKFIEQIEKNKEELKKSESEIAALTIAIETKLVQQKELLILISSIDRLEKKFERYREKYHFFINLGNTLNSKIKELKEKLHLFEHSQKKACPLCKQSIDEGLSVEIDEQYNLQFNIFTHQFKRLEKLLANLKAILLKDHENLQSANLQKKQLENEIQTIKMFEEKRNGLLKLQAEQQNKLLEFSEKKEIIAQKIQDIKDELGVLKLNYNDGLKNNTILTNIRTDQEKILLDLELIETQVQDYQKLKDIYNQIQHLKNNNKFEIIKAEQINLKTEIENQIAKLRGTKSQITALSNELKAFPALEEQNISLTNKIMQFQDEFAQCTKSKEILLQTRGSLESQINFYKKIQVDIEAMRSEILQLETALDDYQTLSQALSKDGIQALLIEQAIPEIESYANNLLSKLTDNQSQLTIESVKDLKSGGTKETLDIKISDMSGIRPYEMFSGGEAFRIDFALRIAISNLLAKRAGASLKTLIIDEGFGSQDEEGLNNIMETILKIQENFEKIIIVSHLPQMKDQFPVHFVVNKEATGSIIKVIENG